MKPWRMLSSHLIASSTRIGVCASTRRPDRVRMVLWYSLSVVFLAMPAPLLRAALVARHFDEYVGVGLIVEVGEDLLQRAGYQHCLAFRSFHRLPLQHVGADFL